MLAEREPAVSRDAATADVTGHLTDLAGILLGFRSPDPPRDEDYEHDDDDSEDSNGQPWRN